MVIWTTVSKNCSQFSYAFSFYVEIYKKNRQLQWPFFMTFLGRTRGCTHSSASSKSTTGYFSVVYIILCNLIEFGDVTGTRDNVTRCSSSLDNDTCSDIYRYFYPLKFYRRYSKSEAAAPHKVTFKGNAHLLLVYFVLKWIV